MKKQDSLPNLKEMRALSMAVGNFIRYWGFRRIHGALWTQIYLSPTPLSATQLVRRLKVSKSLVSPALAELEAWKLILPAQSKDAKTKLFTADPDVFKVIRKVLENRELPLINEAQTKLQTLRKNLKSESVNQQRLDDLEGMIQSAQFGLRFILQMDAPDFISDLMSQGDQR